MTNRGINQMRARLVLLVVITSIMFVGCGYKYDSYESFKGAEESDRIREITNILNTEKIKGYDKFCLTYIDHVITTVDFYLYLEEQFPDPQFEDFLNKAVLTLYYAYNSDNLKLAPEKWGNESKIFLVSYHDYEFGYGEEKFRDYLTELVSDYSDWVFAFHGDSDKNAWAKGDEYSFLLLRLHERAWRYGGYTFYDFKKLDTADQSLVFRRMGWRNIQNNDSYDDDTGDLLDDLQNGWKNRGPNLLNTSTFMDLPDDTPFKDVFGLFLENF